LCKLKWSNVGIMNTPLTVSSGTDRLSGGSIPIRAGTPLKEQLLIELYMSLTGATESEARAALMHLFCEREGTAPIPLT
jgi:hypothetical protein